jgi:hypothetical protein
MTTDTSFAVRQRLGRQSNEKRNMGKWVLLAMICITTLTLVLAVAARRALMAKADEMSQNVVVSAPTMEWKGLDDGDDDCSVIVHVTLFEPDGHALSRSLGLSVILEDGEGNQVATVPLVASQDDVGGSSYHATANVMGDASGLKRVADMRIARSPSEGTTDTSEFDGAEGSAVADAMARLHDVLGPTVEDVLAWRDSEDLVEANLRISTDAEIEGWSQRIDAYLDGTELDGYGRLFAECAATYGVDPRLSPAISTIESGNGRACITPYNAWGWGGPGNWASWESWEEAIEAHVAGLAANGYSSMGWAECTAYCDEGYWDGDPSFCLKGEVLKI